MPAPTKQQDIVVINETYGTPENFNQAIAHKVDYTYDVNGFITQIDELMNDGQSDILRRRTTFTYSSELISTVNTKIYDTDGSTVLIEFTDTYYYSGDDIDYIERTVVM